VVRQDDGQCGHRRAAGANDPAPIARVTRGPIGLRRRVRGVLIRGASGSRRLRCGRLVPGALGRGGLAMMRMTAGLGSGLRRRVHRTVPTLRAHRAVRRIRRFVAAISLRRRTVSVATAPRDERRQRYHLKEHPGDDRGPKAPTEGVHGERNSLTQIIWEPRLT
jgi:hypothetical protein